MATWLIREDDKMQMQLDAYRSIQHNSESPATTLIAALSKLEGLLSMISAEEISGDQVLIRGKSSEILNLLMAALDFDKNKIVATNLNNLYLHINSKVISYGSSSEDIRSCEEVVSTIRSAFVEADKVL